MTTMRAIVFEGTGGPTVLQSAQVERPVRISAEFLVKVVAAGLNPIDAKTRVGKGASGAISHYPVIIGNDFSGIRLDEVLSHQCLLEFTCIAHMIHRQTAAQLQMDDISPICTLR